MGSRIQLLSPVRRRTGGAISPLALACLIAGFASSETLSAEPIDVAHSLHIESLSAFVVADRPETAAAEACFQKIASATECSAPGLALIQNEAFWSNAGPSPSFGFNPGPVWVRLHLRNSGAKDLDLALISATPWIDRHDLLAFNSSGALVAAQSYGDRQAAVGGAGGYRLPTFRMRVLAGAELNIALRYASAGSVSAPLSLATYEQVAFQAANDYLVLSALFALLLLATLHGLALFVLTRAPVYGYFAAALFPSLWINLTLSGMAQRVFLPRGGYALNELLLATTLIALWAMLGFLRVFVHAATRARIVDRTLIWFGRLLLLVVPIALIPGTYTHLVAPINALAALQLLIPLGLAIMLWPRCPREAPVVLLGNLLALAGILAETLYAAGVSPLALANSSGVLAGVTAQAIWFTVALAVRRRDEVDSAATELLRLKSVHTDLKRAQRIQQSLLPATLPQLPGLNLSVRHRPSSAVGGDLYDLESMSGGRLLAVIADVTGNGLPAALDAALVRLAFRIAIADTASAADALASMNRFLFQNLQQRIASAAVACFDPAAKTVEIAVAGLPAPIIVRGSQITALPVEGAMLGIDSRWVYRSAQVSWNDFDFLAIYTNGLADSAKQMEALSSGDNAIALGRLTARYDYDGFCDWLLSASGEHNRRHDDLTLLAFGRAG